MINQLNSDIRKLVTVKSTFIVSGVILLLVGGLSFYFEGYKTSIDNSSRHPSVLTDATLEVAFMAAIVGVLVAILQMGHEYRYNIITHTLTINRSRTVVLLSKILVIAFFGAFFATLCTLMTWVLIYAGAVLSGSPLPPQDLGFFANLSKVVIYSIFFALSGLLLVTLIRNVIAAIAILFIFPAATETIAFLVLKENSIYMPFSVLNEIVSPATNAGAEEFGVGSINPQAAMLLYGVYLLAGWLVTWYLYLRRDAT